MTIEIKTGREFKLFLGLASASEEVSLARDVSWDPTRTKIVTDFRGSGEWEYSKTGKLSATASFDMVYDSSNLTWKMIRNAFFANTKLFWKTLDPVDGLEGECHIESWKQGEPLGDIATTSVSLAITGPITTIDN